MRCLCTLQPWRDVGPEIIESGLRGGEEKELMGGGGSSGCPTILSPLFLLTRFFVGSILLSLPAKKRIFGYGDLSLKCEIEADNGGYSST